MSTVNGFDGAKLRKLREPASQTTLAKQAGISRTYLSELETGKKFPSKTVVFALLAALDGDFTPADLGIEDVLVDGRWYPHLSPTHSAQS